MTKIVFTSCMRAEAFSEQPQWTEVAKLNPDYLFILGDNIYMDYWPYKKSRSPKNINDQQFRELMEQKYKLQWQEKNFKALVDELRKNRGGIYGTWDDHDFAWNNATGNEVPESKKKISRQLFNQYFYENSNQEELFKFIDTEHARVIILDQRSYSESAGDTASLIGADQIKFLKDALNHTKTFTIICGSLPLTISASVLGLNCSFLTSLWSKYTQEYREFCRLIKDKGNVIYVAGDIHRNAFSAPKPEVRQCYEVISSGMAVDQFASQNVVNFKNPGHAYDAKKNWSLFEIDAKKITITQSNQTSIWKRKNKEFVIHKY